MVAERLGFDPDESLTIGQAVAGLNAYAKGVRRGIYTPEPASVKAERKKLPPEKVLHVAVLHRAVPMVQTDQGLRALKKDKPVSPASVRKYLASKFGDALPDVNAAMEKLAAAFTPEELGHRGYEFYEQFRPVIPSGVRGWGAPGDLDPARIRGLPFGADLWRHTTLLAATNPLFALVQPTLGVPLTRTTQLQGLVRPVHHKVRAPCRHSGFA